MCLMQSLLIADYILNKSMKQYTDNILFKINAEIEISCIDSDVSSDNALSTNILFRMLMKKYYSSRILSHSF